MNWSNVILILKREIRDQLRDRRTLFMIFVLPVLLYPITIPVIIAGVRGTAALLQGEPDIAMARAWIGMLVFFDAVFVTLSLWTFEPVMTD